MNGKALSIIAVIIVVIAGWYLFKGGAPANAPTTTTETPAGTTVTYTDQGFSPASVTIPVGGTVTFANQSSKKMWIGSDPHPTHEWYDGTTKDAHCAPGYSDSSPFDECSANNSFTFTFTKAGQWGYHNHASEDDRGTIVVTEDAPI